MKLRVLILVAAFALILGSMSMVQGAPKSGNDIVVFTANWCANCRVIVPIVQDVAGTNGMAVRLIDVDKQDANKQAQAYGLSIPRAELPQVYLVRGGHITLIFDASNFRYGMQDQVRSTILGNLQP